MARRQPARTATEFFRRASSSSTKKTAEQQPKDTQPTSLNQVAVPDRARARASRPLALSEALERAFPCGGCAAYTGGPHLAICPVNYRRRARELLALMGFAATTEDKS